VRRLCTKFETICFKGGEKISEFGMRIPNLASVLLSLGDLCDDEKVLRKFISVVPGHFVQISFSMEMIMDPATLTVEEVAGHMFDVEERLDEDEGSSGGQLLLTEKQWEERKKQRCGGGSIGNGNSNTHYSGDNSSGRKGRQALAKPTSPPGAGNEVE
jgi:hypothetical protein